MTPISGPWRAGLGPYIGYWPLFWAYFGVYFQGYLVILGSKPGSPFWAPSAQKGLKSGVLGLSQGVGNPRQILFAIWAPDPLKGVILGPGPGSRPTALCGKRAQKWGPQIGLF